MRGRTNITQRALPYVNGDVISAIVENNNTISIGDFVEYKTASAVEPIDFTWIGDYFTQMFYGTSYLIALNTNALDIWNRETHNLIYSLPFENDVRNFNIMEDGTIIVIEDVISYNTQNIYYVVFENNTLVIKDTKNIDLRTDIISELFNVAYKGIVNVVEVDNNHIAIFTFAFRPYSSSSLPTYNKSFVSIIDLDKTNYEFGQLSNTQEIDLAYGNYTLMPVDLYYLLAYCSSKITNENKIIMSHVEPSSYNASSYTMNIVGSYLTFDSSYNFVVENKVLISKVTVGNYSIKGIIKSIKSSNNSIAFFYLNGQSTSGVTRVIGYVSFLKYYSDNDNIIHLTAEAKYVYSNVNLCLGDNNVVFITTNFLWENNSQIYRIELLNNNTFKYTEISVLLDSSSRQSPSVFVYKNNNDVVAYSGNKKLTMQYNSVDNELSTGVDTNYVKQYNGGKAIGFAKTAGNAGESIRIYVPHQS